MDVLSEVLRVVRLSGVVHFRADFRKPWAILSSPPEMLLDRLMPGSESVTPFHVVSHGTCFLSSGKIQPLTVEAGDVIVVPRGDQHVLACDAGLEPVPVRKFYKNPSSEHIAVVRHGGDGEAAQFICGFLHSDQRFAPLLESLPALLCIRLRNGSVFIEAITEDERRTHEVEPHEAAWWQSTLRFFTSEAATLGPGSHAMLARLSELLFMEVLRWQLRYLAEGRIGWLAGLGDPQVGRALAFLHAEPARAWTVEALAEEAGISRAALAKRFVDLVGESPMQYLANWRMHLARQLLRESGLGIGRIAERVGYESEAAFNRAFRRATGTPPATWRRGRTGDENGAAGATSDRREPEPPTAHLRREIGM